MQVSILIEQFPHTRPFGQENLKVQQQQQKVGWNNYGMCGFNINGQIPDIGWLHFVETDPYNDIILKFFSFQVLNNNINNNNYKNNNDLLR